MSCPFPAEAAAATAAAAAAAAGKRKPPRKIAIASPFQARPRQRLEKENHCEHITWFPPPSRGRG
eukprot:4473381-Pyramimonas_sp.AAC.1